MKMTVEIELNYLDDDYSLDEEIKEQIISKVSNSVYSYINESMLAGEVKTKIYNLASKKVEEELRNIINDDMLEKYIDKAVTKIIRDNLNRNLK